MSNCAHCNKRFTCGCKKNSIGNGGIVCKQCKDKANNVNKELARVQIQDLRNK